MTMDRTRATGHSPSRPPGSWPRFAGALVVLAIIAIGIPIGVIAASRIALSSSQPLPGIGSVDDVRSWMSTQRSSTEIARVALRVLLSLAWVLWAALVVSVVSSLIASRPRLEHVHFPRLAIFDGLGAWLVAGLVVFESLTPTVATASPPTRPAAAAAFVTRSTTIASSQATVMAPARPGWAVVQPAESLEMFTARTVGDAGRWPEVWELNQGRVMDDAGTIWAEAWRLTAGWELQLPATTTAMPAPGSTDVSPVEQAADAAIGVHRIVQGDTLWDILEGHYGCVDGRLVSFVADNNRIADPSNIPIGTDVLLPPLPVELSSAAAPGPDPSAHASVALEHIADPTIAAHSVVHGDTLWDIVEHHYGRVDAVIVGTVAYYNGLADPNVILVGSVILLPPLAADGTPAIPVTPPPAEVPAPAETAAPTGTEPTPAPPDTLSSPVVVMTSTPPALTVTGPATVTSHSDTSDDTGPAARVGSRDPTDDVLADRRTHVTGDDSLFDYAVRSLWWEVVCGSLLTAGLVTMVRRLRGRRWLAVEPGEQLGDPPSVAVGTELAAASSRAPKRLATLSQLLRTVTPHAREMDDPPPVRAVEFDDDRVEVLFADPAPFPPTGWTSSNGGHSWLHRIIATEPAPSVRQLVTPALVTLGRRAGGGEVLLDIETAGSTSLVGARSACLGMARSIALELATYPLGVPMDVCLIGVDVDGVEHCDRTWTNTTMARAVRVAREMLERTAATGAPSLLAARAAADDDEGLLDPQVFIVDRDSLNDSDTALLDELVELCQPQAGAALVVIGGHASTNETIAIDDTASAHWSGTTLTAPVLSREAVAQVSVMFDHAANAPIGPLTLTEVVTDHLTAAKADEDDDGNVEEPVYVAPVPDVLVRVMGEVTVEGGTGRWTADQTELLTLLVCLRQERPNVDTVATWLDLSNRKTLQNRVSSLRSKLGLGSDGKDLLPSGDVGRGSDGRYRLSTWMMTDVDLLEHRYQASLGLTSQDALCVLNDGMDLMAGPAFQAQKGYNWAAPQGVQARVAAIVNAYATRLMHLALEADRLDLVHEAVRRAELVIDDVIAETPVHRLEREVADATGDPALRAGVTDAQRRLSAYVERTDSLVPDDL
jgi:nucleoid-associated protein YgaU